MMIRHRLTVFVVTRTSCSDPGPHFTGGSLKAMCSFMRIRYPKSVAYGQIEHKAVRSSVCPLLACSLPALVQSCSAGVVEMLRNLSSPLIGWFDTAVECRSDLCGMPASRSRVRRT